MTLISPQFVRFSVTGLGATVMHITIAVAMVELLALKPIAANGTAFGVATGFAYICNTRWSFQARINRKSALRYALITSISFIVTLMLAAWVQRMNWHYGAGITITALVLPILNYIAHRYFTYAEKI